MSLAWQNRSTVARRMHSIEQWLCSWHTILLLFDAVVAGVCCPGQSARLIFNHTFHSMRMHNHRKHDTRINIEWLNYERIGAMRANINILFYSRIQIYEICASDSVMVGPLPHWKWCGNWWTLSVRSVELIRDLIADILCSLFHCAFGTPINAGSECAIRRCYTTV